MSESPSPAGGPAPDEDPRTLAERVERLDAEAALAEMLQRFHPRIALASSFGVEDMVLLDMAARIRPDVRVFTLDTGRLHEETHELIERVRRRYAVTIETMLPDAGEVEALVRERGPFSFRESVADRKACCQIRKVRPLGRALAGLEVWVTGLRREQAPSRHVTPRLEHDGERFKLNPLVDWTHDDVWRYVRDRGVPYNALHDRGFPSIGCAPCTRAVAAGEDPRAGRWWWERDATRECGLHSGGGRRHGPHRAEEGSS